MATQPDPVESGAADAALDSEYWPRNYFNYYTEAEEHFQRARGTGLFLLSSLDWALIESMKNAGVPLEAVLRGIDTAFEKWRAKKVKTRAINSLAYCAQAISEHAEAIGKGGPGAAVPAPASEAEEESAPFSKADLISYFGKNVADLRKQGGLEEIAQALEKFAADIDTHYTDLEALEQRLTALEEKMLAAVRSRMTDEQLFAARRELDLQLKPYRGKMTAEQLSMLERQFLDRKVLEANGLPRLSLFYLR